MALAILLDQYGRPLPQTVTPDGTACQMWKGQNGAGFVEGSLASGVNETGNPVLTGGLANSGMPTPVVNGQRVSYWADLYGRLHVIQDSKAAFTPAHVTASVEVKSGAGKLHKVVINGVGTAGTLTIYDSASGNGTVIAVLTLTTGMAPVSLEYDATITTGLYAAFGGGLAGDFTFVSE